MSESTADIIDRLDRIIDLLESILAALTDGGSGYTIQWTPPEDDGEALSA